MLDGTLTRRNFVRTTAAALAATAVVANGTGIAGADGKTVTAFRLDPIPSGSGCTPEAKAIAKKRGISSSPHCSSCNACRAHSIHKVFATATAAENTRAHKGCRCTIVDGAPLDAAVYEVLFAKTDAVDDRDPDTAKLLQAGTSDGVTVPIFSAATPVIVAVGAGAGLLWWVHRSRTTLPAVVPVEPSEDSDPRH